MQQTIVNMAQSFVGSNNINTLEPCGQFGSRKEGGKDASAARYIFTKMALPTRFIFHEADDGILEYLSEEGQRIEPKYYIPIIPMVLVNGSDGIGTGWSSQVPNYNPRDIIANLRSYLKGEEMQPLTPWYRRFRGRIVPNGRGGYDSVGLFEKTSEDTVEITELPVKRWTQDFKEWLEENLPGTEKKDPLILDYRDNSSHEDIHFTVKLAPEKMERAEREGFEKFFRLTTSLPITNMTLFDPDGRVHRYESELDIMKEFTRVRLRCYNKRKVFLVAKMEKERRILDNRVRFILMVVGNELVVSKKKKAVLVEELFTKGFDPMSEINAAARKMEVEGGAARPRRLRRGGGCGGGTRGQWWQQRQRQWWQQRGCRDGGPGGGRRRRRRRGDGGCGECCGERFRLSAGDAAVEFDVGEGRGVEAVSAGEGDGTGGVEANAN